MGTVVLGVESLAMSEFSAWHISGVGFCQDGDAWLASARMPREKALLDSVSQYLPLLNH
jgi:hypothetical protein